MIKFINLEQSIPFLNLQAEYDKALKKSQKNIEALSVSSYNLMNKEVESRFVNIKYIEGNKFIFFTNYNSPKANAFDSHDQVAALIYWQTINVQIRFKAKIKKMSHEFNQRHFSQRSAQKNALAISSNQSQEIDSYSKVRENFNKSLKNDDLNRCPKNWGGYCFTPYEIEFWKGGEFRLNKRDLYKNINNKWEYFTLQP
jgi:pyridoxamine 5'-phosphate oxidase